MQVSLKELCSSIGLECAETTTISTLSTLKEADIRSLSFFHDSKYLGDLKETKAAAVLLQYEFVKYLPDGVVALVTDEPYKKMALATKVFAYTPTVLCEEPQTGEGSEIAQSAQCAKGVVIGKKSTIMSGVFLGENVTIGDNTTIYPNVTIYHNCKIGSNVTIHSGTVIGSDGFGFVSKDQSNTKFYQIGNVVVEDNVEIGANCTIDRATLGSTVIKSNAKLDNLIQVGHNCIIGEYSIIVSQVGLSGSTTLGQGVVVGGQCGTAGHLSIGDRAMLAARTGVTKSLEGGKVYGGFPAVEIKLWRKMQAALMRLVNRKEK
ncbi:MAG TPA: UDP-3-O-(3-hydroxymyristoyl)glucosamine N-acyltransferase [Nitratifractor sp.]|nr:UDP-3-O-(3-hydroxymyristoyl)glucosamine N-acyltransferase [Nitratifractor sp.]